MATRPLLLTTALIGPRRGLGGDLPTLNFIGPKVWVVPFLNVESYSYWYTASDNRIYVLWTLVAIWLITARAPRPSLKRGALITRWLPTVLIGLAIGFALTVQQAKISIRQSYWSAAVIVGVEAPATLVLYLYLAGVARAIQQRRLALRLVWLGAVAATVIVSPLVFYVLSKSLRAASGNPLLTIAFTLYGAATVGAGIVAWASIIQLAWSLIPSWAANQSVIVQAGSRESNLQTDREPLPQPS